MLSLILFFIIQFAMVAFKGVDSYYKYLDTNHSIMTEGYYLGSSIKNGHLYLRLEVDGEVNTFRLPSTIFNLSSLQWREPITIEYGERSRMIGSMTKPEFTLDIQQ
ncbi:hypothetical protein F9B85_00180 [Heliorestis acidaminivorans]|uniref:Uncharacterized protein n=1 Tax=Heliorestis acidaminivorans TaxID=553427 RepID=A0A6I0F9B3_9FIRM|nr:hypothetical protein [Heliorestis acidaminivorans]KAB2954158.1 hypothetical protein F9B85_00180 [Heliorestis acidaminivorans]